MSIAAGASSNSADVELSPIDQAVRGRRSRLLSLVVLTSVTVAAGRICHPAAELEKL